MTDLLNFDVVVFDLDGTLVQLAVDWEVVATDAASALRELGVEPPGGLWEILEIADETGHRPAVERVISSHERDGARRSDRLPAANTVVDVRGAVGVCSLNCEAACRIALETHDIDAVGAIVGRDTVFEEKPHPSPLLETIEQLDGEPASTLFIGDSERDELTADRAGTSYCYVTEWLRAYR